MIMNRLQTKYKKYTKYNDSGVEWIGEIPEGWEVKRLKYVLEIIMGQSPDSNDCNDNGKGLPFLQGNAEFGKINPKEKMWCTRTPKIACENDILLSVRAPVGAVNIANKEIGIGRGLCALRKKNYKFIYYMSQIFSEILNSLSTGSTFKAVTIGQIKNIKIPIPPLPEQTAIANFLDDKTANIDKAITQKEKLVELLKERKQIIIQNLVTGKWTMDNGEWKMTPAEKLKNSGVEWIGKISEHWGVKRLKYIFNLQKGLTITKEDLKDEGIYCVNYGEIHSKFGFELNPDIHKLKCVDYEFLNNSPASLLQKGDFIFADTSEDIEGSGNFTYLNSVRRTFAGYHTIIAKPQSNCSSRFFAYTFDSLAFRNQIRTMVKGVKVFSISQSILKEILVWIPPKKEQKEIKKYLDYQSTKIDKAIALQQKQIEKLKEYKIVLIDSAVTGKIKVS